MRLSFSLSSVALLVACSLTAHADPILSVKAYDVTGGVAPSDSNAITLSSNSSSTGAIFSLGNNSDFAVVSILASGMAMANGGLSTTTLDASGKAGTSLLLEITQTGLTADQVTKAFGLSYTLNALTSGAGGSVVYSSYIGKKNVAYGMADPLVANYTLNGSNSVASYTTSAVATGLNAGGLYSETQTLQLNFTGSGSMTASSQIIPTSATPEPSSLALLGTGLVGMAGFIRRRLS